MAAIPAPRPDLGSYRDRSEMLAGSVSIVKVDVRGPLLQVRGPALRILERQNQRKVNRQTPK
jgi:hypothetical protein